MRALRRCALPAIVILTVLALSLIPLGGCGGSDGTGNGAADGGGAADETGGGSLVLEEAGTIEAGDTRDADHAGLPYDAYEFQAEPGDEVTVEVSADGFTPLLKLVEVATGAPLAEWEAEYSDKDALTYTIAGSGTCEARVYALEDGNGSYTLTVHVNPSTTNEETP